MFPGVIKIDVKELPPFRPPSKGRAISIRSHFDEKKEKSGIKITKSNHRMNLPGHKKIKTPGHLSRCLRSENKAASDYLRLSFYSLDPTGLDASR